MPDNNIRLHWNAMKNGALKCTIKYPEYSIGFVKQRDAANDDDNKIEVCITDLG